MAQQIDFNIAYGRKSPIAALGEGIDSGLQIAQQHKEYQMKLAQVRQQQQEQNQKDVMIALELMGKMPRSAREGTYQSLVLPTAKKAGIDLPPTWKEEYSPLFDDAYELVDQLKNKKIDEKTAKFGLSQIQLQFGKEGNKEGSSLIDSLIGHIKPQDGIKSPQIITLPTGAKAQVVVGENGQAELIQLTGSKAPTPDQAGRLSMIKQAIQDVNDYESKVLSTDKNGNVKANYKLIAEANAPFGGIPYTEGRTLNSLIENAVQTKLRIETGAQANESEVKKVADRFRAKVGDSPETIANKSKRLREYMQGVVSVADPTGEFTKDLSFTNSFENSNGPRIVGRRPK